MEENIAETMMAASKALHWLGQYRIANALVYCARLARLNRLETLDDLQRFVEDAEANDDAQRAEDGSADTSQAGKG